MNIWPRCTKIHGVLNLVIGPMVLYEANLCCLLTIYTVMKLYWSSTDQGLINNIADQCYGFAVRQWQSVSCTEYYYVSILCQWLFSHYIGLGLFIIMCWTLILFTQNTASSRIIPHIIQFFASVSFNYFLDQYGGNTIFSSLVVLSGNINNVLCA